MNGYKILKCFRKEKRVSGELPCPATGLIGKLSVPLHLGKNEDFFHCIWDKLHKIGKNKAIF